MKRILLLFVVISTLWLPQSATAQTIDLNTSDAALLAIIADLQAQLAQLQLQVTAQVTVSHDRSGTRIPNTGQFDEIDFYDGNFLAIYRVVNGSDISLAEGRGGAVDERVWELFETIAGSRFINDYVQEFRIYDDFDAPHAGFVYPRDERGEEWILAINLEDVDFQSQLGRAALYELLIHEYAHLLFEEYRDEREDFFAEFWDRSDYRHASRVEYASGEDEVWNLLDDYFADHEDEFVSAYATTNEHEDIAESFAFFVLEERPARELDEVDEKLLFFYQFDDFVHTRDRVRSVFSL